MVDSDSDYFDLVEQENVIEDVNDAPRPRVNQDGQRVRGQDRPWIETSRFSNATEFKNSDIAKKLEADFTNRKTREYDFADVLEYECRFKRRVGYLPCPMKMKVNIKLIQIKSSIACM